MRATEEQILERIRKVCGEVLKVREDAISPQSRIRDDLGADSLDTISLLMTLEDEFKSKISEEEAMGLATINDVMLLVQEKMTASP